MTSNIGSQWITDFAGKDYEEMKKRVMEAVRRISSPSLSTG